MKCTTCKVDVMARKNFAKFMCPECGGVEIVRCAKCKNLSSKYTCSKCKFQGP